MSAPIDHERIAELLQDQTRSYRSIAAELGVSDWTVRSVARRLYDDPRPMKNSRPAREGDSSGLRGWATFAGIIVAIIGAIWWAARIAPPEGGSMS